MIIKQYLCVVEKEINPFWWTQILIFYFFQPSLNPWGQYMGSPVVTQPNADSFRWYVSWMSMTNKYIFSVLDSTGKFISQRQRHLWMLDEFSYKMLRKLPYNQLHQHEISLKDIEISKEDDFFYWKLGANSSPVLLRYSSLI